MAEKKKTQAVTIKKGTYDLATPSQMVSMANVLKKHIVGQNLYTNIMGKNYAHVEGWQFAGGLMGMFPRIKEVKDLSDGQEKKWYVEAEIIRLMDNQAIGFGAAICSNKETKKKSFDEYAVLSMAQTRAIGKAYRNLVGYVMKLAGYEGTPKEEMFKVDNQEAEVVQTAPIKTKVENIVVDTGLDKDYTAQLKERVMELAKKKKMNNQEIMDFINAKLKVEPKITSIKSKAAAQMLLARLK